jgi:hypothetical protein
VNEDQCRCPFSQYRKLLCPFAGLRYASLPQKLGIPFLHSHLVPTRGLARRVAWQIGQFHGEARETGPGPGRSLRPFGKLGKQKRDDILRLPGVTILMLANARQGEFVL